MTGYLWRGKPDLERLNAAIMELREGKQAHAVAPFSWHDRSMKFDRAYLDRLAAKRREERQAS